MLEKGFVVGCVAVLLVAGCGDSVGGDQADDVADPTVVFDGESCTYTGPSEVTAGGLTSVVLENSSDIDIDAIVLRLPNEDSLQTALDQLAPGSGSDVLFGLPPGSVREAWLQAPAGGRNEEQLLLQDGIYLFDCGRIPSGESSPDYVWRGGSFEVVTEG